MFLFFFKDPATTEIYSLSLHDALPISGSVLQFSFLQRGWHHHARLDNPIYAYIDIEQHPETRGDRKSTRLNSSHSSISYAVFCLKKKNDAKYISTPQTILADAAPYPKT